VDPVPDPLLLRSLVAPGIEPGPLDLYVTVICTILHIRKSHIRILYRNILLHITYLALARNQPSYMQLAF
jgi:hypothetical protein